MLHNADPCEGGSVGSQNADGLLAAVSLAYTVSAGALRFCTIDLMGKTKRPWPT